MSTILRALPINLSQDELEAQLRKTEQTLTVDRRQIKANLVAFTVGSARTSESPDQPVPVNLASFEPDTGEIGEKPGVIDLIGDIPSEETPDEREAFFENLKRSPLTFICFSDVYINGQPREIVTCRELPDDSPVVPEPTPIPLPISVPVPPDPKPEPPLPTPIPIPTPVPIPKPSPAPTRVLRGGDGWHFSASIVGDDIVVEDVLITCFGGNGDGTISDPQDNGQSASGLNTKNRPIRGVSIAMDGRDFPSLSAGEHNALDGAPIPRLRKDGKTAWNTLVEVTIGGRTFTPVHGIVDLGPGRGASRPGEPHALDLTPLAAAFFEPDTLLHRLSTRFSARGSFRIIGGAKLIS